MYSIKNINLLARHIVHTLPMPGEVDGAGRDVDIHDPVDNLGLEVAIMFVYHILLTSIVQLDKCKMALGFLTNGLVDSFIVSDTF